MSSCFCRRAPVLWQCKFLEVSALVLLQRRRVSVGTRRWGLFFALLGGGVLFSYHFHVGPFLHSGVFPPPEDSLFYHHRSGKVLLIKRFGCYHFMRVRVQSYECYPISCATWFMIESNWFKVWFVWLSSSKCSFSGWSTTSCGDRAFVDICVPHGDPPGKDFPIWPDIGCIDCSGMHVRRLVRCLTGLSSKFAGTRNCFD